MGPAIPLLIQGGSALVGYLASKHAQSEAEKRNPEEQAALNSANQAGSALSGAGQSFINQGLPYSTQAGSYFQTLLRGNRAAMSQATEGSRNAINDLYAGAQRNLQHSGIRGAAAEEQGAQLNRQRAGQVASLISGVQPGAASALQNLGTTMTGQGSVALNSAGNLYQNLLGQAATNKQNAYKEGADTGAAIGGMVYDVASGVWKATGGRNKTPSQSGFGPYAGGYQFPSVPGSLQPPTD
jgi:hypothetical protein